MDSQNSCDIEQINGKDANDLDTHKGTLVAKYYDNEHKLSDISFSVTGGSTTFQQANHLVHRIEGIGYMSSAQVTIK